MHQIETLLPDHWQLFLSNFAAISVQARLPSHPRCGAAVKVGFHAPPLSKFHLYSSCQQGGINCGAIDEPRKFSKVIDERVIINFCDKNFVNARFRDKNGGFIF